MPRAEMLRYEVNTEMQRVHTSAGVQTHVARCLLIAGTMLAGGAPIHASLHFSTLFEPWYTRAIVGYLDGSEPSCPLITVWFPISEFQPCYDILRSERPVYLDFTLREDSAESGYLRHMALGTLDSLAAAVMGELRS